MADTGLWFDIESNYTTKTAEAEAAKSGIEKPKEFKSTLDKDAFLRLLVTQLQYQDPLNPVEDKEFVAQMAQFSALEEMQNMNKATTKSQAFSLIGKTIYSETYNYTTGEFDEVSGQVQSVVMQNNEPYLIVNGKQISLDSVKEIYGDYNEYLLSLLNKNMGNSQSLNLIGKYVQALTVDEKGNASGFIEGMVDQVKFDSNGNAILVVGDKEILANEVISVGSEAMLLTKEIDYMLVDGTKGEKVTIDSVSIVLDKAYLVTSDGANVPIEKINYVTDALKMNGKVITYENKAGKVEGILVKNGIPYFKVGQDLISYKDYKKIDTDTETDAGTETATK